MRLLPASNRRARGTLLAAVCLAVIGAATAAVAADAADDELAAAGCFDIVIAQPIDDIIDPVPISVQCTLEVRNETPPGDVGAARSATVGLRVCFEEFCSGLQDTTIGRTGAGASPAQAAVDPGQLTQILPSITLVQERTVCVGSTCNPEVATPPVSARGARVRVGDGTPIGGVAVAGATVSATPPPVCASVLAAQCNTGAGGGTDQVSASTDISGGGVTID